MSTLNDDRIDAVERDDTASVLVVDDSAVMRAVLSRAIAASGRFVVAGAVAHADAAIAFLKRTRVDIVLLDLEMPGVNGLIALPDLIAVGQGASVLVVSTSTSDGAVSTVQALALGAADTLQKPGGAIPTSRFCDILLERLDRLMELPPTPTETPPRTVEMPPPAAIERAGPSHDVAAYDVVAIGASTGGIHALSQLLRELPARFELPVIVTQHLPATFMPFFAAQVAVLAGRPCDVAEDRMRLVPGRVVIAPGDAHIRLVAIGDGGAAIRLSRAPAPSGCMPSVDPMFESLAAVFGPRALAIVLSGMGRDGADGARHVRDAGGCVVVQDQSTSVVWGMPGAVAAAGLADAILAPDAIGALVATRRRP